MAELRAIDVIPVDLAARVTMGARDLAVTVRSWPLRARRSAQRAVLWAERQHLTPDQVLQLVILVVYGLVSVAEAWAHTRRT